MIVGAPIGNLVGDPVGAINDFRSGLNSLISDANATIKLIDPISPQSSGSIAKQSAARYIYPPTIIIDNLLKDASGGLILNRVTSDTGGGSNFTCTNYGSRMALPYLRNGQIGNLKEWQYRFSKLPNGN